MPKDAKKRLILIDGNSLLYRAFFALPQTLTTSTGVITNAVYGFTSMLIRLIKDEKPDCLAVAFDKGIVTFRHETFAEYKGHRPETPNELRHQFGLAKEVLESLDVPVYEKEGFEADDILATAAKKAEEAGNEVLVVTGDRDAFQLISDHVKVMTTRRGITDIVIYDRQKLNERYGIAPENMPDMLGLKGDPSDNIPGVPGVGEKTATKLIQEYGSLEKVYAHLDEIKGEKLKENLRQFKDQAEVSKQLAILHFEAPVDFDISKCHLKIDLSKARETFAGLEFNTLFERVRELAGPEQKEAGFKPQIKETTFAEIEPLLKKATKIAIDGLGVLSPAGIPPVLATNMQAAHGAAALLPAPPLGFFLAFDSAGDSQIFQLPISDLPQLKPYLEDERIEKLAYESKPLMFALRFTEMRLAGLSFDAQIAAYLLEPTRTSYEPSELASKYLKLYIESPAKKEEPDKALEAALRCYLAFNLEKPLTEKLAENNLDRVYKELELPLVPVLAAMEYRGVGINKEELKT